MNTANRAFSLATPCACARGNYAYHYSFSHGPAPSQRGKAWNSVVRLVTQLVPLECNKHNNYACLCFLTHASHFVVTCLTTAHGLHAVQVCSVLMCQVSAVVIHACIPYHSHAVATKFG